ncbi:MAG TPA: PVC-type heme-binding CxxCH protein [Pirellulales bacterium]
MMRGSMSLSTRIFIVCMLGGLTWLAIASRPRHDPPAAQARVRGPTTSSTAPLLPQLQLDELLKPVPAREPAEALKSFETIPGFRMDLLAHEPDVVDPVAAAFDEQGRLFVTEMRDYPYRPQQGDKPTGRVRMLVDTDGDGHFDQSYTYADELLWPTGVVPWRQGVFVAAAPNIYYFKDTDGDGQADVRRIVYSGFGTQNEQGSVNNLAWGLDGKIYATTSKNGGQIRAEDDPAAEPVAISGRDFCFDPENMRIELTTGGGQFGNAFDDWGNRFLCDQADPSMQVMLPNRYLARNPLLAVPSAVNDLTPGAVQIFRISPLEGWRIVRSTRRLALGERSANSTGLSHDVLDGVAGLVIYRGDAYPPQYRGNLIVGDGQTNLIHRRRLEPDGVTFRSLRADDNTEFVRSNDIWFRPVNSLNAPDGCVYVTDMAREVIESVHVPWDVVTRINLRSQGRGRIYRITPDGFTTPAQPQLNSASTADLVAALAHRGGWWRDTAQRLLRERQDKAAVEPLRQMASENSFELARLHALYTLDQLGALTNDDLRVALADTSSGVREHAVRLAESRLTEAADLRALVVRLAADESPRVRFQVAFSVGEIGGDEAAQRDAVNGLTIIARRDGSDPWIRMALLSSSRGRARAFLLNVVRLDSAAGNSCDATLLRHLAFLVGRDDDHDRQAADLLDALANSAAAVSRTTMQPILLGMASGLRGAETSLQRLRPRLSTSSAALVDHVVSDAKRQVTSPDTPPGERSQAISALSCGQFDQVSESLASLLVPHEPEEAQRNAVQALATFDNPEVAALLLAPWRQYTPRVRAVAVQALFGRPEWLAQFVAAIESGEAAANQVTRVERGMLLAHRDVAVRLRAEKLFEVDTSPRQEVYDRYRPALALQGNSAAGEKIYQRECMACHQIGAQGQAVGPNLALTKHRTPEELLLHVLDPNREVQPAYIQYTIIDRSGGIHSGLIAAETASSITLRRDKNIEQTILKSEIDQIASSDKSLMPEGLEKTVDQQQMADLLTFLKEMHYDIGTQPGRREGGE